MGTGRHPRRCWFSLAVAATAAAFLACAQPGEPPGGPEDRTPPTLVATTPDSGATGLGAVDRLVFTFSEKMDRRPAEGWLVLYPRIPFRKTDWHQARIADVILAEPLPPDTVIVVELRPGMRDMHRVASERSRRFPIATAAELPPGEITGTLVYQEKPLPDGVVELYTVPPDTVRWIEQDPLRRATSDSSGRWRLPWLPVPAGPFLLRAFIDTDRDLRPRENSAQRLLPDTLVLTAGANRLDIGVLTLFAPDAPGTVRGVVDSVLAGRGAVFGWTESIAEEDSAWAPQPWTSPPPGLQALAPGAEAVFTNVAPGWVRVILFADENGDSLFSILPESAMVKAAIDTGSGAVEWYFEPYATVDSLALEPGLEATFTSPEAWRIGVPWTGPPPELPAREDTAAVKSGQDDRAELPDSLGGPQER
jgi:hypothetical protein